MATNETRLSKSRLLTGEQCAKRLWLQVNTPQEAVFDSGREMRFSQGDQAGAVARDLYGPGVLARDKNDIEGSIERTRELLAVDGNVVVFEAAFKHEGVLIFADVVRRVDGLLEMIEVKSSTKVKDYHRLDATIQAWVMTGAGHPPARISIAHIDSSFIYKEKGDYTGLFVEVPITEDAQEHMSSVPKSAERARETLREPEPCISMGTQCNSPFKCEFQDYCRRLLGPQPKFSVDILPGGDKEAVALKTSGINDLLDVPTAWPLNSKHRVIVNATQTQTPWVDEAELTEIRALRYPRVYLDFEGVQFVVPRWLDTRPYQQLPFQWSIHVEHSAERAEHFDFLDESGRGDFSALASAMLQAIPDGSPILVYNATYEKKIIQFLVQACPDLTSRLEPLLKRVVDILPIIRDGWYHPEMKGSYSLKKVLPSLVGRGYEQLEGVANGTQAQQAYLQLIDSDDVEERRTLRDRLETYCALDTGGLMGVVRKLSGMVGAGSAEAPG